MKGRILKLFSLVLVLILTLSFTFTNAYAKDSKVNPDLMKRIEEIAHKYNFNLTTFDSSKIQAIKIKDLDELDKFLASTEENISEQKSNKVITIGEPLSQSSQNSISLLSTEYNDAYTISWWSLPPFAGAGLIDLFCWKNISFSYSYIGVNNLPQFTSVSNIYSYVSGINYYSWNQTSSFYNIITTDNPRDTASVTVLGYYLFGVQIDGFNVGFTYNDRWTGSLKLLP